MKIHRRKFLRNFVLENWIDLEQIHNTNKYANQLLPWVVENQELCSLCSSFSSEH